MSIKQTLLRAIHTHDFFFFFLCANWKRTRISFLHEMKSSTNLFCTKWKRKKEKLFDSPLLPFPEPLLHDGHRSCNGSWHWQLHWSSRWWKVSRGWSRGQVSLNGSLSELKSLFYCYSSIIVIYSQRRGFSLYEKTQFSSQTNINEIK